MRRHVVMGDIAIPVGVSTTHVVEFSKSDPTVFSLAEVFRVQLSCGTTLEVVLEEDAIIHALYTDSSFYTLVGQEFCLLFDIMYAKTGTEAVAESFYRVVEKQEMEGKQSLDVLALRSKIDWCLPPVLQCDSALTEMAHMYIEGDKKRGLKKHYVPVYRDKRSKIVSLIVPRLSIKLKRRLPNFLSCYNFPFIIEPLSNFLKVN